LVRMTPTRPFGEQGPPFGTRTLETTTDAAGRFRFDGVHPRFSYRLRARDPDGREGEADVESAPEGNFAEATVRLPDAARRPPPRPRGVAGGVLLADGTPVPGVRVSENREQAMYVMYSSTRSDGSFSVDLSPGPATLFAAVDIGRSSIVLAEIHVADGATKA